MIYAERNLYRPGETMYVTTVVRDEQRGQVGEIPVKFRLVMPNGKEFATMRKILNNEGSAETSFSLPPSARTGTYNMELLSGNDVLLNSYRISVEDFIPDRIKLTVNLNKSAYAAGDTIQAFLKADNLFGTPAADRNFEATVNMSKVRFSPKGFDDYNFNLKNNFHFNTEVKTGKTNDKGLAAVAFQLKPEMKEVGMIQGNVTATVFDETGRPVHRFEHFKVYTQPVFVGLKLKDEYVSTRKPMKISLVTVDKKGNPRSNVPVQLTLIKLEWHTVIEKNGASYKYVSRKQEKTMKQQRLTTSATGAAFAFTPELSGEYELRASLEGSNSYVSQTFYAYGWGDTEYSSFEVNNEGHISITTGKDKYQAGEDIDVLFSTPFDGRMLVTMERNSILKHFYLETENKTASVKLKADEACIPNVYVTATLIRPMDESDLPLTIAHGFRSVTVENKDYQLPVQVTVSEQTRSRSAQTVTVKTAPGAMVTIAAVDEGILQIKNYKTPDPHQWFYQKQALTTGNYDIYPLLLPEVKTRFSSTGGDGSDESEMRVNPMFVNRVKNVSYWSGIQQADANGIVRYKLNIPQFSGDLRVMAAAYKGKGFGAKEEHIKVADPIVVSVGLPRFLSPGDEVLVPVTLSNTTTKTAAATVRLELTGPLRVLGNATENINVSGNRDGRVVFRIGATEAVGAGKVLVTVSAMKEKFLHETELSIRPPASLQKISQNGIATAQAPASILIPNKFIPSTARSTILFGNNPMVQFTKNLSDLVNYPYGCLEQTVSAAFPQLYYKDLVMSLERRDDKDPNPAYNVQQAINKIQGMQLEDGSLSFWPGTWSNNWWGSVYAAHFLLEAKKAGFEVNHRMIEGLLSFLKHRLGRKETEMLHYNGNQMRKIAAKEICYSLYILANAGQTQLSTMNYYKAHLDELSIDSKYLLAAAYTRAGMPTQAREVLPASFSGEQANQSLGGNFYSWIRDEAISLNAMLDTDPTNPQIAVMAQHLSQQMKEQPYLNTQENAFGILALGKLSRLANQTTGTAILTYEGKQLASSKGPATKTKLNNHIGASINLGVQGKGTYYYTWEVSGITADGSYVQEDRYIKVRRSFYTRNGQQITNNSFRQNDLIIVKLSIESLQGRAIENVAITDMLPAGLEIENSRLVELPGMEWIKDPAVADYLDIRDDRLNLFTTVTPKRQDFWYMARAVSPGTYKLGPVMADAMYNGAFHSYHGAGTITVREQ